MSSMKSYPTVSAHGEVTHVMVPVGEFLRLVGEHAVEHPSEEAVRAAAAIYQDPATEWHDAEGVFRRLLADGIAEVRRGFGLSQTELGERAGMSQSAVSRCEGDPEGVSVRVLRKIAEALSRGR